MCTALKSLRVIWDFGHYKINWIESNLEIKIIQEGNQSWIFSENKVIHSCFSFFLVTCNFNLDGVFLGGACGRRGGLHPGRLHPPGAVHQGAVSHCADGRLPHQPGGHQDANQSHWTPRQGLLTAAAAWHHPGTPTGLGSKECRRGLLNLHMWFRFHSVTHKLKQSRKLKLNIHNVRIQCWRSKLHSSSLCPANRNTSALVQRSYLDTVNSSPCPWRWLRVLCTLLRLLPRLPDAACVSAQGYDNTESSVRKASVFCLVAIYSVIGEDLKPHLALLTGSKVTTHTHTRTHNTSSTDAEPYPLPMLSLWLVGFQPQCCIQGSYGHGKPGKVMEF